MPLVLMCGPPCSGKSTRAAQLRAYMSTTHPEIEVIIVEDDAALDRNALYGSVRAEKDSRGRLRSEVQRVLTKTTLVILDAPNYIKGFRYELYCLSKGSKTTHCVIHCDVNVDQAWSWNEARKNGYEKPIFDALFARFEAPDSRNRWDSPMFVVRADDNDDDDGSSLPDRIHAALYGRRPPPPNQSTQCQPLASTNYLYDVDRSTQEVVANILAAQKDVIGTVGEFEVRIPSLEATFTLGRVYTPMELARLRRQFIVYIKMHPVDDSSQLVSMFAQYLKGCHLT